MKKLRKFDDEYKVINARAYNDYKRYGMDDGWHPGNKIDNFNRMVQIVKYTKVPLENTVCLDVGCGTGDLSQFLKQRNIASYTGIDIDETAVEKARKKYPDEQFISGDILVGAINGVYDYTFSSGALTVKLPLDNYIFLYSMVAKMWEITKVGVVFNFLTDEDDGWEDDDLFFYSPKKVLDICYSLDPLIYIETEKTPNRAQMHVYLYR